MVVAWFTQAYRLRTFTLSEPNNSVSNAEFQAFCAVTQRRKERKKEGKKKKIETIIGEEEKISRQKNAAVGIGTGSSTNSTTACGLNILFSYFYLTQCTPYLTIDCGIMYITKQYHK